jgi:hypothetical protein
MADSAQTSPAQSPAMAARSRLFARMKNSLSSAGDASATVVSTPAATQVVARPTAPIAEEVVPPQPTPISTQLPATEPSVLAQVAPQVIQQNDQLNPPGATGSLSKEQSQVFTVEHPAIDHPAGVVSVEQLRNPEIPVEVESYLQKVAGNQEQLPEQVVIADATAAQPTNHYLAQPVIVLPITPEVEKKGAHRGTKFSIRWLVEWSWKVMKMFKGQVIYRQT